MNRFQIVDSRDGKQFGQLTYATSSAAEKKVKFWQVRFHEGKRSDLKEIIDHLTVVEMESQ